MAKCSGSGFCVELARFDENRADDRLEFFEFCNEQMNPAEVLGVEVRQYSSGTHVAYVPRVVGRTSDAVATKQTSKGTRWTRESFLAEVETSRCAPGVRDFVHRLIDHVDQHGTKLAWGTGMAPGVGGWYDLGGRPTGCWALNLGDGTPSYKTTLVLNLGDVVKYTNSEHMEAFASQLEAIPALKSRLEEARALGWKKWPAFPLAALADQPVQIAALFAALDTLAPPAPTAPSTGTGAEPG